MARYQRSGWKGGYLKIRTQVLLDGFRCKIPPHRTGLASKQRRGCVTSCGGRTRKEIAEEFGIGLSTLTRWLSRRQGAVMN
ncbi:helix-turn-helix domain-containing protein [Brucella anthropi]|uniref:Helix-turn-helix domain-containing protein n=1 Tax=Brucella anthropi TaxID=529 RepID=A0A6L3Z0S6_BRUAN|nr:helix-turn-helix domain-containing protein [Brucella anthropi]HBQ35130.1 hypothetical protein [Brucella anthropi]